MTKKVLVVDWLDTYGGAERVIRYICHAFKFERCYALVNTMNDSDVERIFPLKTVPIEVSWAKLFGKKFRYLFVFFPWLVRRFKIDKEADVIISSSHAVAKGVRKSREDQIHVSYFQARNMKYIWSEYKLYFGKFSILLYPFIKIMRKIDVKDAQTPDYIISNSKYVKDWVKKVYNRDSIVIYPPADLTKFKAQSDKEDYYIAIGRIEPYKRFDIIVDAFNKIDRKLILVGDGSQLNELKNRSTGNNIEFVGFVDSDTVFKYLSKAKGFIHAGIEDFGIAPIEAQACGTPVIGYGYGGLSETVIENKTGVFFKEHNADSLIDAIERFDKTVFDYKEVRKNAERFSIENFELQLTNYVEQLVKTKKPT